MILGQLAGSETSSRRLLRRRPASIHWPSTKRDVDRPGDVRGNREGADRMVQLAPFGRLTKRAESDYDSCDP